MAISKEEESHITFYLALSVLSLVFALFYDPRHRPEPNIFKLAPLIVPILSIAVFLKIRSGQKRFKITKVHHWFQGIVLVLICISILTLYVNLVGVGHSSSRAKVARAKSEIRNLAVALETYYIDNNSYPPAVDKKGEYTDSDIYTVGYSPRSLTTPVVHQSSLPTDPFALDNPVGPERTYQYASSMKACWIMTSLGPDGDDDMDEAYYIKEASCNIESYLSQFGGPYVVYDPTNGIFSNGDVFRTGP